MDLDHGPQPRVTVNPRVLEYETLVSLAQLKLHDTATVTLTLKNIDLHGFIAGMAKRFPIGLGIIVGHPAMIATGPLGGKAAETGLVVASLDPVAADVVGARLLGFRLQAVRHLWEAARIGVGEGDLEAIRRFTRAAYGVALTFEHA